MRIRVDKSSLLEKIQPLQNIINPRLSLPILSNILLETDKNNLTVTATDLDIGVFNTQTVEVIEEGAITLHAKRFFEIIRSLPEGDIDIIVRKNNAVVIETQKCHFRVMGQAKDEFPKIPTFKNKEIFKIDQLVLKEMLALTSFAMSSEETRYILNSVLFEIKPQRQENVLRIVATDGRRLAVCEKKINLGSAKHIKVVIPAKTIHELNRNLKDEEQAGIVIDSNQILFELNSLRIVSRLMEGEYPDYEQVIPKETDSKIWVERAPFIATLRRAALLSTVDYQATRFEIFKNKVVISKSTPDLGELREEIPSEYSGKELAVGFNPAYFLDILKNLDADKISIEITEQDKPATFRNSGSVYVVLPMRL